MVRSEHLAAVVQAAACLVLCPGLPSEWTCHALFSGACAESREAACAVGALAVARLPLSPHRAVTLGSTCRLLPPAPGWEPRLLWRGCWFGPLTLPPRSLVLQGSTVCSRLCLPREARLRVVQVKCLHCSRRPSKAKPTAAP